MTYLLDTVSFIWLVEGDGRLSGTAVELITDPENDVYLSVASAWEIAIKCGLGRLHLSVPPDEYVVGQREAHRIAPLAICERAALQVAKLPTRHGDLFDRILVAQAITAGMAIITNDPLIRQYPVNTAW